MEGEMGWRMEDKMNDGPVGGWDGIEDGITWIAMNFIFHEDMV